MKKSRFVFIAPACFLLTAGSIFFGMSASSEKQPIEHLTTVTATELVEMYHQNKASANKQFLNKLLLIEGVVDTLEANDDGQLVAVLSGMNRGTTIKCIFRENAALKTGDKVTLKGLCTEFFGDIVVIDCVPNIPPDI